MNASGGPLVSILVRSMDRPTLARALDSAAAQTCPQLEIVVVAACGGEHRALPDIWGGRPLRIVFAADRRRLTRPEAANAALDAATGEWLNFLDDDDELLPEHVAKLLERADSARARVIYSRARVHDGRGSLQGHVGFESFPVLLYYQNRNHPAATLFHRSLVNEGARFDPEFLVHEDHDFFVNCATRTSFRFVDAATCIWNAHDGESRCGHGTNQDDAQRDLYLERLRAKWASFFAPLLSRPEALLTLGQHLLRNGQASAAVPPLERALALSPGDVNALNLCAMANFHDGRPARAEALLVEAERRLPAHPGIRQNLDLVRGRPAAAPLRDQPT